MGYRSPYIHGWKDHPLLPNGVVYEGVAEFEEKPQKFRGETGAQSSIVPLLDAALGVIHTDDPLRRYLEEMNGYMPPRHRTLIAEVGKRPPISKVVSGFHDALHAYNECLEWIARFREKHYEFAASYINKQARTTGSDANPTDVGTGGTPFMKYLKKHIDETRAAML